MTTKIISAEKLSSGELSKARVELSKLPPGEYQGIWGGYEAIVEIDGVQYRLKTKNGIRAKSAPCIVFIKMGEATIETS
jgi:hypothetical protein